MIKLRNIILSLIYQLLSSINVLSSSVKIELSFDESKMYRAMALLVDVEKPHYF